MRYGQCINLKDYKQWSNNISDKKMKHLMNNEALNKKETESGKNTIIESNFLSLL